MRTALGFAAAAIFVALNVSTPAYAKLAAPQLTPVQQAKAAEAKAKAAEAAKREAAALAKAQDRAVESFRKGKGKTASAAPAAAKKK